MTQPNQTAVKEYHPLRSSTGVGREPCTSIDTQLAEVQVVTVRDTTLLSHQMDDLPWLRLEATKEENYCWEETEWKWRECEPPSECDLEHEAMYHLNYIFVIEMLMA